MLIRWSNTQEKLYWRLALWEDLDIISSSRHQNFRWNLIHPNVVLLVYLICATDLFLRTTKVISFWKTPCTILGTQNEAKINTPKLLLKVLLSSSNSSFFCFSSKTTNYIITANKRWRKQTHEKQRTTKTNYVKRLVSKNMR